MFKQFLCLKNIRAFLHACVEYFGLSEDDLFDANELYDVSEFKKVSLIIIWYRHWFCMIFILLHTPAGVHWRRKMKVCIGTLFKVLYHECNVVHSITC